MLSPDVRSLSQLGQSNPLSLALPYQVTFELGKGSHDAQQQMRHGRVCPGKGEVLFLEPDVHSAIREPENHLPKIVQVARQPIHRMADHGVALTYVPGQLHQFRPVEVLAGSLIHKAFVESDAFKLSQFFLVERADTQVADKLTSPTLAFCNIRF